MNIELKENQEFDIELITIRNVKKGKDYSECDILYDGQHVSNRIWAAEHTSEDMLKMVRQEVLAEMGTPLRDDIETEEEKAEIDAATEGVEAMKSNADNIITILKKKGFVRGAIIEVKTGEHQRPQYAIFTGEFKDFGHDDCALVTTNGSSYNYTFCNLITDINKDIFQMIDREKVRIRHDAEQFINQIDSELMRVIYED